MGGGDCHKPSLGEKGWQPKEIYFPNYDFPYFVHCSCKKLPMFLKCSRHKAVLSVAYILKSTYLLLN